MSPDISLGRGKDIERSYSQSTPSTERGSERFSWRGAIVMGGLMLGFAMLASELGIALHRFNSPPNDVRTTFFLLGVTCGLAMVSLPEASQMGETIIKGASRFVHKIRGLRNHQLSVI